MLAVFRYTLTQRWKIQCRNPPSCCAQSFSHSSQALSSSSNQSGLYPYVDPDKITTMFLFATSPLLSQSGNTKSSIKGNTLNSDSLNRKSPCSSSLYKRRHCLPSVTAQTRLLLFNKCLWLHKQKIKSHHSSTRSAISLASLTARAS